MQGADERLAKLAGLLNETTSDLPREDAQPATARVKGAGNNVNFGTQLNIGTALAQEQKYISSAQRQALNALVQEISAECAVEARMLWRDVVHTSVGVESIGEIRREAFPDAREALVAWREEHNRQANCRQLVARITSVTKAKGLYDQRDSWCLRQFGEKHLTAMNGEQLRQVYAFVEDYQRPASNVQPQSGSLASVLKGVLDYPWQFAATFAFGLALGAIFF